MSFSPDGAQVAAGSIDSTIKIWRTDSGRLTDTLHGHSGAVLGVAWSPDGARLASASDDGTVRLWQPSALARAGFHRPPTDASIYALRFSPDGKQLFTGLSNGELRVLAVDSGAELRKLAHPDWIGSLAWRADGRELLVACGDARVHRWDTASWTEHPSIAGHDAAVVEAAWLGTGDAAGIVSTSRDNTLKVWDATSGALRHTLSGHQKSAETVAAHPDGRRVASGGRDGTVRLWDVASGRETAVLRGHDGAIQRVAWRPDGSLLASAGDDGSVRLWDAASATLKTTLRGHSATVTGLAWSPDGTRLASGGSDDTVRLWDPEFGQELVALHGFEGGVWQLAWSSDGERLAATTPALGYRILAAPAAASK